MTELTESNSLPAAAFKRGTPVDTEDLTRSAGRGALWQMVGAGWQMVVQLGASVVLARVLAVSDFGIMGMAMLVQGLVGRLSLLGTRAGLIAKQETSEEDLSTSFWITAVVHGILFLIVFLGAPLFALYFKPPEDMAAATFRSNLVWVFRATSFSFLFSAAGGVSSTLLNKQLRFGTLKLIDSIGFSLQYGLAIFFAVVLKMGYWSLVLSLLINNLFMATAKIICARWRPTFVFSRESFRYHFRFGVHGFGAAMTNYFHNNIDYMLIGNMLGAVQMGYYEYAYRLPHLVLNKVAAPIRSVLFPTLSKVQDSNERLAAGYLKTAKYISLMVFPALGGLLAVAGPAVLVLWGDKWAPVILPLQILCLRAGVHCVLAPLGTIFMCKDRPDIPFKCNLYTLVFTFLAVGGLGYAFGLNGVALGMLVSLLPQLVYLWLAFRLMQTPLSKMMFAMKTSVVSAVVSSLLAWGTVVVIDGAGGADYLCLMAAVIVGAGSYFGTMFCFFRSTIREVTDTVRIVLARRK